MRRFVHRSIREHFVARRIAALSPDKAAEYLLPHLWYDPDWEYAAPAAIAMHPYRAELLHSLIRQAGSGQFPENLSAIDAGWEFRRLLVRIAAESSEADWPPWIREMITQARTDLVGSGHVEGLSGDTTWKTANYYLRDMLIDALHDTHDDASFKASVEGIVRLCITTEDKEQIRATLIQLLAGKSSIFGSGAADLAWGISHLDPTTADRRTVADILNKLLATENLAADRTELLDALLRLGPTTEERRTILDMLLTDLMGPIKGRTSPGSTDVFLHLDLTAADKRRVCGALIKQLTRAPGQRWIPADLNAGAI